MTINNTAKQSIPEDILAVLGERYGDIEYLSSGATGAVFRALDKDLDKQVAIKVLKSASDRDLLLFQKEARAAAQLEHKNLVSTLNFGITSANNAYIILEFVDGLSLERFIESNGRIPIPQAINLLLQILSGLAHAHSKDIAHRDLKTSNVMIYGFGTNSLKAVIIDFGLALDQKLQEESQMVNGDIFGSPLFISPEQAKGARGDSRSDIYSLGCIAYHLIAGVTPFQSEDLFSLFRMHIEDQPPTLSDLAPDLDIPDGLQECLDQMLEKEPEDRFQNVEQVSALLSAIEQSFVKAAEAEAFRERVKAKTVRATFDGKPDVGKSLSRKSKLAISAICFVVLIGGVVLCTIAAPLVAKRLPQAQVVESTNLSYLDKKGTLNSKKFYRVWRVELATILEEHEWTQISPKDRLNLTDSDLNLIKNEPYLKTVSLNLSDSPITGEGLSGVNRKEIEVLDLSDTKLSAAGYKQLTQLTYLQKINLSRTDVGEKEFKQLAKLPKLKELQLAGCKNVNDACLEFFGANKTLEEINVSHTQVTDRGLVALGKFENLTRIELVGFDSITDDGVHNLLNCKKLDDFKADSCKRLTGITLKAMTKTFNKQLKGLALGWTNVKAEDLDSLIQCPEMSILNMSGTKVTDRELKMLSRLKRLTNLYLSDGKFSDKGLKSLVLSLDRLSALTVVNCGIDVKTLKELQTLKPKCAIVSGSGGTEGLPDYAKCTMDMILSGD